MIHNDDFHSITFETYGRHGPFLYLAPPPILELVLEYGDTQPHAKPRTNPNGKRQAPRPGPWDRYHL